jgi:uncharacterized protein (TIGR00369 family)
MTLSMALNRRDTRMQQYGYPASEFRFSSFEFRMQRTTHHEPGAKPGHRLIEQVRKHGAPIARLIGFEVSEVEDGRAVGHLDAGPQHANPMGTLHGGILCDLADAAMGMAFASTLDGDQSFTTLELKINFLRPFWTGRLRAEAEVVSRGKTAGLVECSVTDERKRLIARASSTCLVLRGEQAAGR